MVLTLADPLELIAALGIITILLIYGPKKIPELARAFGAVKRAFQEGATVEDRRRSESNAQGSQEVNG